jgi:sugar phosphate isomerase/epimerase
MKTRTGNFPIGFRRGWTDWQKKDTKALAKWAKENGFESIDLGKATKEEIDALHSQGIQLGSADLLDFSNIMASDEGKRRDVINQNVAYVKEAAAAGAKIFFTVILPADHAKTRAENYKLAVDSYKPIFDAADKAGAKIVIEGWPGGRPHLSSLCCTPETYRTFIKDMGTSSAGINYDPSHLIRLGVDHIRFLREFAPRVFHVHAKDTELMSEAVYEFGLYQPATFAKGHGFGEHVWRYTIPGHGETRWGEAFKILHDAGYKGVVSIELEDVNFNTGEEGEKAGLLNSLAFLKGV